MKMEEILEVRPSVLELEDWLRVHYPNILIEYETINEQYIYE